MKKEGKRPLHERVFGRKTTTTKTEGTSHQNPLSALCKSVSVPSPHGIDTTSLGVLQYPRSSNTLLMFTP